ncbi:hypothetical protein ACFPM3_00295 [Streptomyces coeruleoprunus]|uniref:Uncharacterized protein n=1 Tax=Streptomyces coeruleoprunus TaxID=285563 RepID=A0ABV9X831_9ACTN
MAARRSARLTAPLEYGIPYDAQTVFRRAADERAAWGKEVCASNSARRELA